MWLMMAISDNVPVYMSGNPSWIAARDDGNKFLQENDIPGKFVGDEPPDEDEILECDSARFTGTVGVYDMNGGTGWSPIAD